MKFTLKKLISLDEAFQLACRAAIDDFYSSFDYTRLPADGISSVRLAQHEDLSNLYSMRGFYVILSDYKAAANPCRFEYERLKAIYRGHCRKLKKRIESHLFNADYEKDRGGTAFDSCMQLDGKNGINIDDEPYCGYSWIIIQHKMPGSTKSMREFMEHQFDVAFDTPLCSLR